MPRCQQVSRTPPFAAPLGTSTQVCRQSLKNTTQGKSLELVLYVKVHLCYLIDNYANSTSTGFTSVIGGAEEKKQADVDGSSGLY